MYMTRRRPQRLGLWEELGKGIVGAYQGMSETESGQAASNSATDSMFGQGGGSSGAGAGGPSAPAQQITVSPTISPAISNVFTPQFSPVIQAGDGTQYASPTMVAPVSLTQSTRGNTSIPGFPGASPYSPSLPGFSSTLPQQQPFTIGDYLPKDFQGAMSVFPWDKLIWLGVALIGGIVAVQIFSGDSAGKSDISFTRRRRTVRRRPARR
jgi:hypothetical protein